MKPSDALRNGLHHDLVAAMHSNLTQRKDVEAYANSVLRRTGYFPAEIDRNWDQPSKVALAEAVEKEMGL